MKKISSKRSKTDADFEEMARIEWYASLYLNHGRVCIPSLVMESALVEGARKLKLGKTVLAGMYVPDDGLLQFDGDTLNVDELWTRDKNRFTVAVRVQRNKVMRTRCIISEWQTTFEVCFDDETLNPSQVSDIVQVTGRQSGLCDWRPKFGRFSTKLLN